MTLSPGTLASASGRHPWWTLFGWVLVLAGAFALTITLVADALDGEDGPTQTLEYEKAGNLLDERFGPLDEAENADEKEGQSGPDSGDRSTLTEFVLITSDSPGLTASAFDVPTAEFNEALIAAQEEADIQVLVGSFAEYSGEMSEDGTTLLTTVRVFESHENDITILTEIAEDLSHSPNGFEFLMIGDASVNATFMELAEEDLFVGEMIGIGVAIIILALVFGAVVAAFIPI
ncbi:MAG: MMPL family transporter, partial [Dehalococcoidia bacterium]|nr:MMPL family transporter [Dehalococcoidia bacterium]